MSYLPNTILKLAGLLLGCLMLAACGPVYDTSYSYVPPTTWRGKECVNSCLSQKQFCHMQCIRTNSQCHNSAMRVARREYRHYVRRRHRHHKPVLKSPSDFADFSGCTEACGCEANYRQCYSNCGGQVITHQICVAFCKKAKPSPAFAPAAAEESAAVIHGAPAAAAVHEAAPASAVKSPKGPQKS